MSSDIQHLKQLAKLIRYWILLSTTEAGSGHPTSSLSAVELMVSLMFGGFFKFDLKHPDNPNNDRLIFSKGHASPLFYSLYAAAGELNEADLKQLRKFTSQLEGHPTPKFPYAEVATGSLGQGLSIGVGMALNAKYLDKLPYRTYVLLGDSEFSEGSNWEALQIASHYKLNNLIGILDVNRLGQRGETMHGHNISAFKNRIGAFNWNTITVDGHDFDDIELAYQEAQKDKKAPIMIIAKTFKGKGISFLENQENWHGKSLSEGEFKKAKQELGGVDKNIRGTISSPIEHHLSIAPQSTTQSFPSFKKGVNIATRKAYGITLAKLGYQNPNIVSLDAEVCNSTYANIFAKHHPTRFFEMYIAEQNMVSAALGLSRRGKIPFVSTFASFLTRAYDQIRMAQYSASNIKLVGSHAGVSIGEDGPSQMGLEDIAMMRAVGGSVVLYPSDAVSTEILVRLASEYQGMVYLRTTRSVTPVIYTYNQVFLIGGSQTVKQSSSDAVTLIAAGITLHESLKAFEMLSNDGITARVIDLYSIKPIDTKALKKAASETSKLIVIEDHHPEGGMAEAVRTAVGNTGVPIHSLAVRKMPMSGTREELLDYEEISANAIVRRVKEIVSTA